MRAVLVALALLMLPVAAAQAAPTWQAVGGPQPGERARIAVSAGVPYVASLDAAGRISVRRPGSGGTWVRVGGFLNAGPTRGLDIAASGQRVWVAWDDGDVVHVARLEGGSWHELGGGGFDDPGHIVGVDLAILGGRPYVGYTTDTSARVIRLKRDGSGFATVDPPDGTNVFEVTRMVVAGGRLYALWSSAGSVKIERLNATKWVPRAVTPGYQIRDVVAGAGGSVVFAADGRIFRIEADGTAVFLRPYSVDTFTILHGVLYFDAAGSGGIDLFEDRRVVVRPLPDPPDVNADGDPAFSKLLRADGTLWLLWRGRDSVHVARLVP